MSPEEPQEKLLLWVFVANDGRVGELNHAYARDEVGARAALNAWIIDQTMLGRRDITVKHYPGGFMAGHRAYWPGSIPAQSEESEEAR